MDLNQRCHEKSRLHAKIRPPSFETEATNSTYQLAASEAVEIVEAVEAGLTWPETSAFMSRGCIQSFNLLALKLRLLIEHIS